jgi:hypothetical protein
MLEQLDKPLISRVAFCWRLIRQLMLTIIFGLLSLVVGMCGYHYFERMDWLDAFVNAAMLLGGMGPVDTLHTPLGKFFAGCYALYCGVFLVVCGGLLLVPVFHRVLHYFHAESDED